MNLSISEFAKGKLDSKVRIFFVEKGVNYQAERFLCLKGNLERLGHSFLVHLVNGVENMFKKSFQSGREFSQPSLKKTDV